MTSTPAGKSTGIGLPLGQILIDRGLIAADDLDRALELQRERGDKLGKILLDMGFIAQRDLLLVDDEPSNTSVITRCCDDRLNSPWEP